MRLCWDTLIGASLEIGVGMPLHSLPLSNDVVPAVLSQIVLKELVDELEIGLPSVHPRCR